MTFAEMFQQTAADARGLQLNHVWRGYGTAIFLEFGELSEQIRKDGKIGNPAGEITIGIESDWRIERGAFIVCGSMSDEGLKEEQLAALVGSYLGDITIFARLPEICVRLSGHIWLMSFTVSTPEPDWMLIDRRRNPNLSFGIKDGEFHLERDL